MSVRSILFALVIVGAATQASATPPPPAAPPTNPIELVVVRADGERRVATLDERQVRAALGRNIFYSIVHRSRARRARARPRDRVRP
jgi:hypothetical protein